MWFQEEKDLHVNDSEMNTVQLALNAFLNKLAGELVLFISDNATVMAYLQKHGSTGPQIICDMY